MGLYLACKACPGSRSAYYRSRHQSQSKTIALAKPSKPRGPVGRALTPEEKAAILAVLHSEEYADQSPREIVSDLLCKKIYLCSVSTMYRLLREHSEVRERRNQLRTRQYAVPELIATEPNQVWSWDITKLKAEQKWTYYYLYVIMDIYSRYVVGWCLTTREDTEIAKHLIMSTCLNNDIQPDQLTIHADRGSAMTSKGVSQLLADLKVTQTHSRPHVSNDNCYSEAQFKTMKYRPDFPQRFDSQTQANEFCVRFFNWYNKRHCHAGIAYLTPEVVHNGNAQAEVAKRQQTMNTFAKLHPERFVAKAPAQLCVPAPAYINPPKTQQQTPTLLDQNTTKEELI